MTETTDKVQSLIDAWTAVFAHLVLRVLPIVVSIGATVLVWHAYQQGKVVIESAAISLFTIYGIAAGLYGVNILLKAKAATINADRRLDSTTPGLPAVVSKDVAELEAQQPDGKE